MTPATDSASGASSEGRRARAGWAPWALVLIVALAAVARLSDLGAKSYWLDEATSVYLARLQFMPGVERKGLGPRGRVAAMVGHLGHDAHPPLYQTVLLLSLDLLGPSERSARLPSALAGLLTVLLIYRLGLRLYDGWVALVAAALAAVSAHLIYFSREARLYSLLILITTAHANVLVELLRSRRRRPWAWVGYVALGAAGMWTYVLYGAVLAGHWVFWGLYAADRRGRVVRFVLAQAVIAALFAPWAPRVVRVTERVRAGLAARPQDARSLDAGMVCAGVLDLPVGVQYALTWRAPALSRLAAEGRLRFTVAADPSRYFTQAAAFWLMGAAAVVLGAWRRGRGGARLYSLCFVPVVVALAAPAPRLHVFEPKHVAFAAPFLLLAVAAGVTGLGRWSPVSRVLVAALAACNLWGDAGQLRPGFVKEPWREVIAGIEARAEPWDVLVFAPAYAIAPDFAYARRTLRVTTAGKFFGNPAAAADVRRVWLVELEDPVSRPGNVGPRFAKGWRQVGEETVHNGYLGAIRVTRFER